MSLKAAKAKAAKFWNSAVKKASEAQEYGEYEDGRYSAQIIKANRNESKNSGRDQASISFKFLEGEYKGKTVMAHHGLDNEMSQMYFIKEIKALKYEVPDSLDEIENVLKKMEKKKPKVSIKLITKGEYQNVYIVKPITDDEVDDAEGSEEVAGEEGVELEKGMKVEAEVDGETITGVVTKINEKKEQATIEDEDGDEHTALLCDIEVLENTDDDDNDDEDSDDDDSEDEDESEEEDSDDDDDEDSDDEDEEEEEEEEDEDEEDEDDEEEEPKKKSTVTKKKGSIKKKGKK